MLNKVKEFTKSLSRRSLPRSGLAAPSIIGAAVLGDPLHPPFSGDMLIFQVCLDEHNKIPNIFHHSSSCTPRPA
jgi:hypothetical protein